MTPLPHRAGECRRTPRSWAAAACSVALASLQVDLLAPGTERGAYLAVVLLAGAATTGTAGLGMALRNCVVARTTAAVTAVAIVLTVTLLVTLGLPGAAPVPLGHRALAALLLGLAVPLLVGLDATSRPSSGPLTTPLPGLRTRPSLGPGGGAAAVRPLVSDDAHPGPARGGRSRHRTHPRPGAGA